MPLTTNQKTFPEVHETTKMDENVQKKTTNFVQNFFLTFNLLFLSGLIEK
jgi:hypothetical protein